MQKQNIIFFLRKKITAGYVMAAALLLFIPMTTLGVVSLATSSIELKRTENWTQNKAAFYTAENGWRKGAMWLESRWYPPLRMDSSGNIVINTDVGKTFTPTNGHREGSDSKKTEEEKKIPHELKVQYINNKVTPGAGTQFRRFRYNFTSTAADCIEIDVVLSKLFKTGY